MLTAKQQRSYLDNGNLFPIRVMSAQQAAAHVRRLTDFETAHGHLHYRVKPYLIFRSAYEAATHPQLLDAVESVLGPDILLWDSSYIIKEPRTEGFVSWHQDLTYWGLDMESDDDLVSVWLALTAATQANGAMRFVNGSHRSGRYNHEDTFDTDNLLHRGQTIPDQFSPAEIASMELDAGQASLHHGWAVHCSGPNSTAKRRVGLVMNFAKPSVRQTVGRTESATLVRGRDDYGHFAAEPECVVDMAPDNLAFQQRAEQQKRAVYDTA